MPNAPGFGIFYLRDGCVFREGMNIYDKMAATIKYANDVQVSYSPYLAKP